MTKKSTMDKALATLRKYPARDWSGNSLAQEAKISKTAVFEVMKKLWIDGTIYVASGVRGDRNNPARYRLPETAPALPPLDPVPVPTLLLVTFTHVMEIGRTAPEQKIVTTSEAKDVILELMRTEGVENIKVWRQVEMSVEVKIGK